METFTRAGMEPQKWESALASMSAKQLKQLATVVRASAAEQLGQAAVDDIVVAEAVPPVGSRQNGSTTNGSNTVAVTFADSGDWGVKFRTCSPGSQPVVAAITTGSAASRTELQVGQALVKVQDMSVLGNRHVDTFGIPNASTRLTLVCAVCARCLCCLVDLFWVGMVFADIIKTIKSADHPVRLTLVQPISATFSAGALGLKMHNDYEGGPPRIKAIVPGSPASRQANLNVGMVLVCINKHCIIGRSFKEAIAMAQGSSRPMTLTFTQDATVPEGVPCPTAGLQLGPLQPDREHSVVRVRVCTWNCGNASPSGFLRDIFAAAPGNPAHSAGGMREDIMVLGLQESVLDQDGASVGNASKAKQIMKGSVGLKSPLDEFWVDAVAEALGDGWSIVSFATLGEMRLLVFARSAIVPMISEIETAQEACGIGGVVGNKGGLVVKFKVNGTSLCFISCHLAAHEGEKKATKRNDNIREVLAGARVGPLKWMDAATQFDHTWFIGDLNYRVDLQQLDGVDRSAEQHVDEVIEKVANRQYDVLQRADQLHRELSTKRVLVGFTEGRLNYAPTFKVERDPALKYIRKRVPSYCDRILFRSLPGLSENQRQEWVQPVVSAASSDHKPVTALHSVLVEKLPPPPATRTQMRVAVTLSNLHGSKLTAMDPNGKSDPYVRFDARGCWQTKKKYKTKVLSGILDPRWSHKDVPTVEGTTFVDASRVALELNRSHLFLSVWDYDRASADDLIGSCVLPLSMPWNSGTAQDFSVDITNDGVVHGHLAGRIQCHYSVSTDALFQEEEEEQESGQDDV